MDITFGLSFIEALRIMLLISALSFVVCLIFSGFSSLGN